MPDAPRGKTGDYVALAIRLCAAGIWLVAGISKLADLELFRLQVERYLILPHGLAAPFAYAIPFLETGLGAYLAAGLFVRGSAVVGTGLMVIFLAAQIEAWARGLSIDCGCFGSLAQAHVGFSTVLRDLALGLPTFLLLAIPARLYSLDSLLSRRSSDVAG